MSEISGAINTVKTNFTSDSPVNRGLATGVAGAVLTGGSTGLFMVGTWLKNGNTNAVNPLAATGRATITGAVGFGTLGALSNVRLSNDRYIGGAQGAALGFGVGSAGTAILTSVWSPEMLRTPKPLMGAAMLGGAIGGAVYGVIGLTGVAAQDRQ